MTRVASPSTSASLARDRSPWSWASIRQLREVEVLVLECVVVLVGERDLLGRPIAPLVDTT